MAAELASRWQNLHDEDKEKYEKISKEEKLQKSLKKKEASTENAPKKQAKLTQFKPNFPQRRSYWKMEKSIICTSFLKATIEKRYMSFLSPCNIYH